MNNRIIKNCEICGAEFETSKFTPYVTTCKACKDNTKSEVKSEIAMDRMKMFTINQRFSFMEKMVDMVIKGISASLFITGKGGLGKSYTVKQQIAKANLIKDQDYIIIKGFSTAKGLFNTLADNRDKLVIFDDCDSILEDKVAKNILKAATDSYDERIVTWANDTIEEPEFEFTGQIIFISNIGSGAFDQALKSRALLVDLSMDLQDKLERIESVMHNMNGDDEIKTKAFDFIKKNADRALDLNFRTMIKVMRCFEEFDDEELALYMMMS